MTELPTDWVSIDPGDKHVGFAFWHQDVCLSAFEITPTECVNKLETLIRDLKIDAIVYEKFALYAWNERSMSGNEFLTSQLIGVIKYLAHRGNVPVHGQFASQHKRMYKMGWFRNMPLAEKRLLPWWGNGDHAKDAWIIGMWFKRERAKN